LSKIRNLKVGGPGLPRKKVGNLDPCVPQVPQPMSLRITPSFAGHSFRIVSGETRYCLPIHSC